MMNAGGSWQVSVVLVSFQTYLPATCTFIDFDGSMHHRSFHNLRRYHHQKVSQQTQLQDTG